MARTKPNQVGSSRRGAFTLMELLIVMAIIGALSGLLLPSLSKARTTAKRTQCLNRLRSLYITHSHYIHDFDRFPDLNNDLDDGAWQYNYLIFDGEDFEQNFGPLISEGSTDDVRIFFCPVQEDPFHMLNTPENPWPVVRLLDTRAGYARRYHLSGKSFSELKTTKAFVADVFHLPKVVKRAHKTGVNVVYSDGHGQWVSAPKLLLKNDLNSPFDRLDNDVIRKIWKKLDNPTRSSRPTQIGGG